MATSLIRPHILWGWMKGRIFHRDRSPRTLDELKAAIEEVAEELRQNRALRERALASYAHRLGVCLDRDGAQVEIR